MLCQVEKPCPGKFFVPLQGDLSSHLGEKVISGADHGEEILRQLPIAAVLVVVVDALKIITNISNDFWEVLKEVLCTC